MTDDAIVAEIVGYTLYRKTWSDCADMIICWPPDVELFTKPEVVLAKDLGDYDFQNSTMRPPRFISAPTWASDGIVLEWVQGSKIFPQFTSRMRSILAKCNDDEEQYLSHWHIEALFAFYKPGMYAKAVLASTNAEDGSDV